MKPTRELNRRSFMAHVVGGVAIGAAATVIGATPAEAQTDRDSTDAGGHGYTGITDRDSSDRPGHGRGRRYYGRPYTGVTDRDANDRPGHGRGWHRRSCTDSDSGRYADGAGRGRRC